MAFFDFLFGKPKPEKPKKETIAAAATVSSGSVNIEAPGISPEVVAAIAASIYAMMGTEQVLAVRINRSGNQWAATGRQRLMDSRQVI